MASRKRTSAAAQKGITPCAAFASGGGTVGFHSLCGGGDISADCSASIDLKT